MGLPLSPDILKAAYEFLLHTPPFNRLKLPPADEVKFRVTQHLDREGDYFWDGRHNIRISERVVGHTSSLLEAMGHEMIHVHEENCGIRSHHGRGFKKLAHCACRYHGWDPFVFIGTTR